MSFTPNRIVLISRGRHEEGNVDVAFSPGMLLAAEASISTQAVVGYLPHNVPGGAGPIVVAEEDAWQGGTVNTAYVVNNIGIVRYAAKGDELLMRLASGQSVAALTPLMSNGDGTLTPTVTAADLLNIVADSNNVTNTNTETTFTPGGSYAIPAGTLAAGDVVRIQGVAVVTAQNSTNTNRVKVKIGSTILADSTALNLAANAVVEYDVQLTIRTVGNSGTYVVQGTIGGGVPGTAFPTYQFTDSAAINTNAANTITITDTQSAASTGNTTKLSQNRISLTRSGGFTTIATSMEAINNSGGTTPFIRCLIN